MENFQYYWHQPIKAWGLRGPFSLPSLMLKVSKCIRFLFLFFSVCLPSMWNNPIPIAVVIWALKQCFSMLGGRRIIRQAFCSNDGRWNIRERDDESSFFFSPTLLILSFSASQRRISRSVWIIVTKLFDFISQFPQQLKGKGGDHSLPPQTPFPTSTPTRWVFFPLLCKCTDIISVRRLRVKR